MYDSIEPKERGFLFDAMLRGLEVERDGLQATLSGILTSDDDDPISWTRRLTELRRLIESPRLRAFRTFLATPGGLPLLLDMRAAVLTAQREANLDLEPLEFEIADLFDTWFQGGLLFLSEITLESPFREINFIKEHDRVHPAGTLEEMIARLGNDRRLFALFHRAMPQTPIVFIEVALTRGVARSINEILGDGSEDRSPGPPDTAIFYSINNTQHGLSGLGLGKALILQVVEIIRRDNPGVKVFATLSPIPGLWEDYLERILEGNDEAFTLKRSGLKEFFSSRLQRDLVRLRAKDSPDGVSDFPNALRKILADRRWIGNVAYRDRLAKPLTALAYFYITEEKNRRGRPLNPVAGFHLGNGARVRKADVNFGADRSERGLSESCGLMVNYVYSAARLQGLRDTLGSLLPWRP